MMGDLKTDQVEEVLKKHFVGRIGCQHEGHVFIVPVSYVYNDDCVYVRSFEGKKISMMRKNPKVCFEVDETQDMSNWQSVIAWGEFEEITDSSERSIALQKLIDRHLPVMSSATTHLGDLWPFPPEDINAVKGVVFRIRLNLKTGRFEKNEASPVFPG